MVSYSNNTNEKYLIWFETEFQAKNFIFTESENEVLGILEKFPPLINVSGVKAFIKNYCNNNNVVAIEHCSDSYWNYLSNDTEIDYTIC